MPIDAIDCDLLVIGDEVESVITAVSAARLGVKTLLARRSLGRLGGLSVRGGLSYMDITPEFVTGLFQEFLERAGVVRVALNPDCAHETLSMMLTEAGVEVVSGVDVSVETDTEGFPVLARLQHESGQIKTCHPRIVIDATPDADIARALGAPYVIGLGGILDESKSQSSGVAGGHQIKVQDLLGVSPVFRIQGVEVEALRAFEAKLRENPLLPEMLAAALPYHTPELRAEYVTRPTYAPPEMDYLDILNPVIGIDYHIWKCLNASAPPESWSNEAVLRAAAGYAEAGIAIDGANISRLSDGSLGFNGLVARAEALDLELDDLLAMSQDGPIPAALTEEMACFERYLRERAGFPAACVIPPEAMYVRQTVTLLSRENMTARKALSGGVSPDKAVGTFSYWLDLRGVVLSRHFPGEHLPKPVFNVGLNVALPLRTGFSGLPGTPSEQAPSGCNLQNFAFVSRSAGYSPIGQGAGRIVQHNAMLGEAVGVAAALAIRNNATLEEIADHAMPQVQEVLAYRRSNPLELTGHPTASPEYLATSELLRRDDAVMMHLQMQVSGIASVV